MIDPRPALRAPRQLIGIGAAVAILAVAALLSGPLFGPPRTTRSPTVPLPTATPDRWAALRRPLAFPPLEPNGDCPTTADNLQPDGPGLAPMPGPGPVYPLGAFQDGRLYYDVTRDRWDDTSLLWLAREGQAPDALVRGRRLDAPPSATDEIGFGDVIQLAPEMQLDRGRTEGFLPGWVFYRADFTRVKEPGCYGIQIDTAEGSERIVFEARPADEATAALLERPVGGAVGPAADCSRISAATVGGYPAVSGPGPAYLAWSPKPISLAQAPAEGDWRLAVSAPWVVDPRDRGPLVVRSATDRAVAFDGSNGDQPVMQGPVGTFISTPGQPAGWRTYFADILVRAPGCYVLQVDLLTASYAFAAFDVAP